MHGWQPLPHPVERTEVSTRRQLRMATEMAKEGVSRRIPPSPNSILVNCAIYGLWHSYCSSCLAAHETFFARPGFHTQACFSVAHWVAWGRAFFTADCRTGVPRRRIKMKSLTAARSATSRKQAADRYNIYMLRHSYFLALLLLLSPIAAIRNSLLARWPSPPAISLR